ncbi:MAG TPA: hypothetical protein VMI31_05900 [Fimbriimonadaceae bacterium]|nr:hypothetical protein [Fimbriimonadaceae bacterium]
MERPLEIRLATKSNCISAWIVAGVFLVIPILMAVVPDPHPAPDDQSSRWLGEALSLLVSLFLSGMAIRTGKQLDTVWYADDRSVRKEVKGRIEWECRWEDFGGWRPVAPRAWWSTSHQHRREILNRAGQVVGAIDIVISGPGDVAYFKRELDRNTPEGGPKPEPLVAAPRSAPAKSPYRSVAAFALGLLMGGGGLALHASMLRAATNPDDLGFGASLRADTGVLFIPVVLYFASAVLLVVGSLGLISKWFPMIFNPSSRPVVYGPSLADFRMDRRDGLRPVTMEEGRQYGYVDPDALRQSAQAAGGCLLVLTFFAALMPLVLLVPVPDRTARDAAGILVCFLLLALPLAVSSA